MKLGKNCRFLNTCQLFNFLAKPIFWKLLIPQHSTCWILFILTYIWSISLCKTREWDEADWLGPLISRHWTAFNKNKHAPSHPILEKGRTVLLLLLLLLRQAQGLPLDSEMWWTGELWANTSPILDMRISGLWTLFIRHAHVMLKKKQKKHRFWIVRFLYQII